MASVPESQTGEQHFDAAFARAREFEGFPRILNAAYHSDLGFLMLRLDDGRRLLIPREELSELANATDEQASQVTILSQGRGIWWPQLDDGLYLPDFLQHRWHGYPPHSHAAA